MKSENLVWIVWYLPFTIPLLAVETFGIIKQSLAVVPLPKIGSKFMYNKIQRKTAKWWYVVGN